MQSIQQNASRREQKNSQGSSRARMAPRETNTPDPVHSNNTVRLLSYSLHIVCEDEFFPTCSHGALDIPFYYGFLSIRNLPS